MGQWGRFFLSLRVPASAFEQEVKEVESAIREFAGVKDGSRLWTKGTVPIVIAFSIPVITSSGAVVVPTRLPEWAGDRGSRCLPRNRQIYYHLLKLVCVP
jgi:hypothetical protein